PKQGPDGTSRALRWPVDEHRAAQGLIAQAIADDAAERLEQRFAGMNPDTRIRFLWPYERQTRAQRFGIGFDDLQKPVSLGPMARAQGEAIARIAHEVDADQRGGVLE